MRRSRASWLLALGVLAVAQTPAVAAVFKVKINGKLLPQPTRAVVRAGRLMMPLRSLPEALGFAATWEQATHTAVATRGDTVVRITVGSKAATVNGEATELPAPAEIINDTAYVPVRFLAETFGAQVEWTAADTGVVDVLVNGRFFPLEFATIIRNETAMVPTTRISQKLFNASVLRHEPEQAVFASAGGKFLRATLESTTAYANGEKVTIGAAPELVGDLFYVPLKFLVEAFGGSVTWDPATRTLDILARVEAAGGAPASTPSE